METYSGCANYNLYHTCRGCLSLDGTMLDILTPGEREQNLLRIYMGILNSEVSTSDYPFLLCHQCEEKLLQNHAFQNQCQKSYKVIEMYLTDMADRVELNDVVVKEENIITYVVNDNDNSSSCNNNETVTHASEKKDIEFIALDNNMDTDEPNPTKLKDFCEKCNENVQSLSKHQSKFHVNEVLIKSEDTQLCSHCGEIFSSNSLFVEHLQTHINEASSEIDDADLPFICRVCNKLFHGLEALKNHVAIHAGENVEPNSNNERFHRTSDLTSQRPKIKDWRAQAADARLVTAGLYSNRHLQIEQMWPTESRLTSFDATRSIYCSEYYNSIKVENLISSSDNELRVEDSEDKYIPDDEETGYSWTNNDSIMLHVPEETDKKSKLTKNNREKKYNCPFCDAVVPNFTRHVLMHDSEAEVQEILTYNTGERKRKSLLDKLRKRGNISNESVFPVRKSKFINIKPPTPSNYLTCKYCQGFFQKKLLSTHTKSCPHNSYKTCSHNSGKVIKSRGRAKRKYIDKLSSVAKRDTLICAIGKKYLKDHPYQNDSRLYALRKMKQLASLLIEIKKKIPIGCLLNALDPINFEIIVECSKLIAPSSASNIGNQLIDCIDVAYNMLLEVSPTENENTDKLKLLKELISNEFPSVPTKATPNTVRNKEKREIWTDIQKEVVLSYFKDNLKMRTPPARTACIQLKEEKPDVFFNKTWAKMKIFVVNTYTRNKKNSLCQHSCQNQK